MNRMICAVFLSLTLVTTCAKGQPPIQPPPLPGWPPNQPPIQPRPNQPPPKQHFFPKEAFNLPTEECAAKDTLPPLRFL
jgi:hypothetical protein